MFFSSLKPQTDVMKMEGFMRSRAFILVVLGSMLLLQGCSSLKGATKGFREGWKDDWEAIKKTDVWIKENMW